MQVWQVVFEVQVAQAVGHSVQDVAAAMEKLPEGQLAQLAVPPLENSFALH